MLDGAPTLPGRAPSRGLPNNTAARAATSIGVWLRRNAVRYVLLPQDALDDSALAEASLLSSGRSGLRLVYRDSHVTILALRRPAPLVIAPPGESATVLALGHDSLTVELTGPGRYRLAVSYTPYWRPAPAGRACISPADDGFSTIIAAHGGAMYLRFDPTLASLFQSHPTACATASSSSS
jgi:hypothetical protein